MPQTTQVDDIPKRAHSIQEVGIMSQEAMPTTISYLIGMKHTSTYNVM